MPEIHPIVREHTLKLIGGDQLGVKIWLNPYGLPFPHLVATEHWSEFSQ